MCPLFFPDRYFPHLSRLAGPTYKKIQSYFFKILSKVLYVDFCLVFRTGLGMEIGHRQPEPQRKPSLQFSANPAVVLAMSPVTFCPLIMTVTVSQGSSYLDVAHFLPSFFAAKRLLQT